MKVKIWAEDLSALEMSDWIARLRDQASGETAGDGATEPEPAPPAPPAGSSRPGAGIAARADDAGRAASHAGAEGAGWAAPGGHDEGTAWAAPGGHAEDAGRAAPGGHPEDAGWAVAGTHAEVTERSVIGDELRIPIAWCELGSCISYHSDPAALGEADIRGRALYTGWRIDGLGRLTCPQCQQRDPWFWPTHQVALWDRRAAVTTVALMATYVPDEGTTGSARAQTAVIPASGPAAIPAARPAAIPAARPAAIPPAAPAPVPTVGNWTHGRHRKRP